MILLIAQLPFARPIRDWLRLNVGRPIRAVDGLTYRLKTAFTIIFSINDLAKENAVLTLENNRLQAQVADLQAARSENARLKNDLNFQQSRPEFKLLPANIINFSPTSLYQAVTIDQGSEAELISEQVVVSSGFLIGKVKSVSVKSAEVWLLTNRNLLIPVNLPKSETVGIMRGGIRGLVVENIPLDTKIEIGETVVTSSLEGLYPAGIAVGKVEEVVSAKEEIFLTLRISSPVNFGNLTNVFVIK